MADTDVSWVEPVWNTKSKYPYNNATQSKSGHTVEYDDTPGAERVRVQHRSTTFTEMQPDGSYVTHVMANNYHIVAGAERVKIYGDCVISIEGNCNLQVQGDTVSLHHGNLKQVVEGDYDLLVKGQTNINSGQDMKLFASGADASVYLNSLDGLNINGDLHVSGQVSSESVHSTGSVTAGTGIHAGLPDSANPIAGISTLGGINVGIPGPTVPGVVTATVMVTAPVILGSVMTYGAILMDPEGGAPMIRTIYDAHTHIYSPGPGGPTPTAPPVAPMP